MARTGELLATCSLAAQSSAFKAAEHTNEATKNEVRPPSVAPDGHGVTEEAVHRLDEPWQRSKAAQESYLD